MRSDIERSPAPKKESIFHVPGFRALFTAAAVSQVGNQLTTLAIPVVAITALSATPGEVGLLGTLNTAAFLLLALPAGAWLDRARKRTVMMISDAMRALLLLSVPVCWYLGQLSMWQLCVVVFAVGIGTVFFDIASMSVLPSLVGRNNLLAANGKLSTLYATTEVSGLGAGGFVIQVVTAPLALVIDVGSYLLSFLFLSRLPRDESTGPAASPATLKNRIGEGLAYVFRHPLLRPIALEGACINLSVQLCYVMLPLVLLRDLAVSEAVLGVYLAAGGAGMLLGAAMASRIGSRLGQGKALWVVCAGTAPAAVVIPLVNTGPLLWITGLAWLVVSFRMGVNNVLKSTLRQRITPNPLLARMNATTRFMLTGSLAIGSALAGAIGQLSDERAVLWTGAAGIVASSLIILCSPFRGLRDIAADQPA